MWESEEHREENARKRVMFLITKGFTPLSDSRFMKNGKVYDLSAADLEQLERIEREGLFVIKLEPMEA
jgi:hypothetical protein